METPTQAEVTRAVTNDPALSENEVTLSGRTFKLVDLPYDDYLVFLAHLEPLFSALFGQVLPGKRQGGAISVASVLTHCGKVLPEMVRISLKQTEPEITVEDVKKMGNPFTLSAVVLRQIEQNRMVADLTDFFVQILPLMTTGAGLLRK